MGTFSQDFNMNKLILFALFALVAATLAYPEYDRPAPSGEMDSVEGESMESGPMESAESAEARKGKGRGKGKKGSKGSDLKNLDQWNAAQALRKRNPALRKELP